MSLDEVRVRIAGEDPGLDEVGSVEWFDCRGKPIRPASSASTRHEQSWTSHGRAVGGSSQKPVDSRTSGQSRF